MGRTNAFRPDRRDTKFRIRFDIDEFEQMQKVGILVKLTRRRSGL